MTGRDLTDADGQPFEDDVMYTDRHGDTWRACYNATKFGIIAKADGTRFTTNADAFEDDNSGALWPWFTDADRAVARYGPLKRIADQDASQGWWQ